MPTPPRVRTAISLAVRLRLVERYRAVSVMGTVYMICNFVTQFISCRYLCTKYYILWGEEVMAMTLGSSNLRNDNLNIDKHSELYHHVI